MKYNKKNIFDDFPTAADLHAKVEFKQKKKLEKAQDYLQIHLNYIRNKLDEAAEDGKYQLRICIPLPYSDVSQKIYALVKKHFSELGYKVEATSDLGSATFSIGQPKNSLHIIDGYVLNWEPGGDPTCKFSDSDKNSCS